VGKKSTISTIRVLRPIDPGAWPGTLHISVLRVAVSKFAGWMRFANSRKRKNKYQTRLMLLLLLLLLLL
jgi:hypothetical protein